ncbi:MAG: hypothetical protein Q7T11_09685 [Deltaproteobacteria bacterium]|nr:hypothetical protein [Deltaproteobacteria bacterium]
MLSQDDEWLQKGVDIWQIRENLKLSFEDRARQHQYMLHLIEELNQIGAQNRERSSNPSQTAASQPR